LWHVLQARYVVQAGEYEYATHTTSALRELLPHNFVPLRESGQFDFVTGEQAMSGISVCRLPDTAHHQGIRLESDGEVAFYVADLVPHDRASAPPVDHGYDVEPLVTLETKRRILSRAATEGWELVFEHDATTRGATSGTTGKRTCCRPP